jgi:hypothetical protein
LGKDMKIEFNPSRATGATASQSATKGVAPVSQQDSASLGATDALKSAINNIPLVRPEKVDSARAAVSDTHFPPDAMLKAVASLIAEKIQ